ncbi:ABC transporter permease [Thermoanaerobacterium xylanolyticum]|uniref:ABC transporter permease n=1 Tax=Thermoanaerobacterium xylanolyticum TaxID=29329 RepID=UPI0001FAF0A4|nr:ABC transporter permease [Thermoanaerobacterium xylanolyticum]
MAKLNYNQIKNGPKEQTDIANLKVEQSQATYDLSNLMVKIGYTDFMMVFALSIYWFRIPVNGSIILLLLLGFDFIICALAIGMLISTAAKTQTHAMQGAFMLLLPTIILSGFIFSREQIPSVIRAISDVIPLTYFLDILRGIIIKGVNTNILLNQIIIMTSIGFALFLIAVLRFRKRLD